MTSESLDYEDLFRYTSGRWLMNEAEELSQRYRQLSVDGLKMAAVAAVSGGQYCSSITKIGEGEYNRALLITVATDSGSTDLVAKIPYPRAGPAKILTASEVATLEFCRDVLQLPVPKVLGWSANAEENAVGAEYILMERAEGVPIADRWEELGLGGQLIFSRNLLRVQNRMLVTTFGANGSLYYQQDVPKDDQYHGPLISSDSEQALSVSNANLQRWCIGPSTDRDFYSRGKASLKIDRGPWPDALSFTEAIVDRQIRWFEECPPAVRPLYHPFRRLDCQEDPEAHISLLRRFRLMLKHLVPSDATLAVPVMSHQDLHPRNIFVQETGLPNITCILDWQDVALKPLFMQADIPKLLAYAGASLLVGTMKMPPQETLDQLSENEIAVVKWEIESQNHHFFYQKNLNKVAPVYYRALDMPGHRIRTDSIHIAANTYSTEIFPDIYRLRERMRLIIENWSAMGMSEACPVSFSPEELRQHEEDKSGYDASHAQFDTFEELLGMRSDGRVDASHYEQSIAASKQLRDRYEREVAGLEVTKEEVEQYWPLTQ
ncbi:Phosphotransferase enzyme [Tulasnella sp. JGI-2019a]|nr:Phosphotransferase enzyme [Tulasnella sp. JGI-2019a]KAG9023687.1 Phosphotransferase enzyme [Tulasnella sp. JGI-2019a]